jgi:hypothetical protein
VFFRRAATSLAQQQQPTTECNLLALGDGQLAPSLSLAGISLLTAVDAYIKCLFYLEANPFTSSPRSPFPAAEIFWCNVCSGTICERVALKAQWKKAANARNILDAKTSNEQKRSVQDLNVQKRFLEIVYTIWLVALTKNISLFYLRHFYVNYMIFS